MLALAGCQCFLPGKPPEGNIVNSYDPAPRSVAAAVNELSNSLTAFGLTRLNGKTVQPVIHGGAEVKSNTERVLRTSRNIVRFGLAALDPDYILNSAWTEISPGLFRWEMNLAARTAPEEILWRQAVTVDVSLQTIQEH